MQCYFQFVTIDVLFTAYFSKNPDQRFGSCYKCILLSTKIVMNSDIFLYHHLLCIFARIYLTNKTIQSFQKIAWNWFRFFFARVRKSSSNWNSEQSTVYLARYSTIQYRGVKPTTVKSCVSLNQSCILLSCT